MAKIKVHVDPDLEPIMGRYLELRREEQLRLEQALAEGDGEMIRFLGHKMKGTGTSYGFVRLTELGAAIERVGREGDFPRAAGLIAEAGEYMDSVEIIFGEED